MTWTAKDFIEMGFKPSKKFGDLLKNPKLFSMTEKEVKEFLKEPEKYKINLSELPCNTHYYINPKDELEQNNLNSVINSLNILCKTPTVTECLVMPDACPVGEPGTIPVGTVVKTYKAIHPGFHSEDVCCSLAATNFGKMDPKLVLDAVCQVTHFGPGNAKVSQYPTCQLPEFISKKIASNRFTNSYKAQLLARSQFLSQGDGNHFSFVGVSEKTGDTYLITHQGSRGFGAQVYKEGLKRAQEYTQGVCPDTLKQNAWLEADSAEGQEYWEALQIVRKWTKANHYAIARATGHTLGMLVEPEHWNEHNFVFKQDNYYWHAKGATPTKTEFLPDTLGIQIVPLNMSEPVLFIEGTTDSYFAPHGAGRNFSRKQHLKSLGDFNVNEVLEKETKGLDIRFWNKNPDLSELPSAYKNAQNVIKDINDFNLAKVLNKILPYGTIMAGRHEWRGLDYV